METEGGAVTEKKTDEFLMAEYRVFAESFWRNEESGERRVNFLITLVTTVIAAAVALITQADPSREGTLLAVLFALFGLLTFGIVTLLRMLRRNHVTDEYKHAMDRIRDYFRDAAADRRLADYEPFPKKAGRKAGTGGLVDIVSLVNSLVVLAMGLFFGMLFHLTPIAIGIVGAVGFIVSEAIHFWFIRQRYEN